MKITPFDLKLDHCPLCISEKIKAFAKWNFKGIGLQYDQCQYCGFIFLNPTYTTDSWSRFYKADYRALYNEDSKPASDVLAVQQSRANHYSSWLKTISGKVSSHLDIGSSAGIFLKQLQEDFGIERSFGIEPGDDYRDYASKNGFEIYEDIDTLIATKPAKFDLVTMCHVLEHIPDMVGFLSKIRKNLLASKGYLFIEVPNIRGGQSFEVAHPNCFSLKTLKDSLELAGFELMKHAEHGMPRTDNPESKIYLSALAMDTDKHIEQASKATMEYLDTSLIHIRKGFTLESWPVFWMKYPFRKLFGRFPV